MKSRSFFHSQDPLGPLLFALVLHPLILDISKDCKIDINSWFLDDGTVLAAPTELVKAYRIIQRRGPERGIFISPTKTEIWWPKPVKLPDIDDTELIVITSPSTKLLGSSIGQHGANSIVAKRVGNIRKMISTASLMENAQLQLALLRACIGYPKINFVLRTIPSTWIPDAISSFDAAINEGLHNIWNCSEFTSIERHIIAMPTTKGGIGVPVASQMATSAYAASLFQSAHLQMRIRNDTNTAELISPQHVIALEAWHARHDTHVDPQVLLASEQPQRMLSERAATAAHVALLSLAGPRESTTLSLRVSSGT